MSHSLHNHTWATNNMNLQQKSFGTKVCLNIAAGTPTSIRTRDWSPRLVLSVQIGYDLKEELQLASKSMYYEKLIDSSQQFRPSKMTIVVCHFCNILIFLLFFVPKYTFTTIAIARWKFPTLRCLWCYNMCFWMFSYVFQIGLNLAKHRINRFWDICHFIFATFGNNYNTITTAGVW